jgi:hypothetical protein
MTALLVSAMSKRKLRLVRDKGKPQVSNLSPAEEARALELADIALHNPAPSDPINLAGSRAKADHRRLIEEVQRQANKVLRPKRAA